MRGFDAPNEFTTPLKPTGMSPKYLQQNTETDRATVLDALHWLDRCCMPGGVRLGLGTEAVAPTDNVLTTR